ncbi:unnamed protein product [Rotaria sp. Silwood1]|nr:unnamed protein product [Rotaria sp. Silwood1]
MQLLNSKFQTPSDIPSDDSEQLNFILHKIFLPIIDRCIPATKAYCCTSCNFTVHTRFSISYIPINMVEAQLQLRHQLNSYFDGSVSDHLCDKCSMTMSRRSSVIILRIDYNNISSTVLRKPPNAICLQSFLEKTNIGCPSSTVYDVIAFISIMPNLDNKLVLATKIKQCWRINSMTKLIGNGEKLFGCKGILLSPSVKSSNTFEVFRRLVPELDQNFSSTNELSAKAVPTLKHVILTGTQTSVPGVHSYEDLIKRGSQLSHQNLIERQASIDPDAPVEIFYTSGTTGQPKATALTSFGVLNLIRSQWEHFGQFFTRLCVPIPMFHVFSEIVGVLNAAVAKCHLTFPAVLPDTVSTMRAIHEEKCTALIGAPIIFRDILMHPDRKKYNLTSLVFGLSGATAMHIDFLRQLEKEFPITRMAQAYGMTETAGTITSSMWAGDDDVKRRLSSIGRSMPGIEIKIVDQEGNTVPMGKSGEIQTRGHSVMREYYGDVEKTKETITPSRWLRTGDEGKMDEDGYVYFVERKKNIINRGGVKIYSIEVENTIAEHPYVADAQVFSVPNERYDEEVCAWIRLKPDASKCQVEDIRNFLKDRLAFFKIPTYIRIVDKFIMTPTGKAQKFKMSETMANELQQNKNKH